MAESVAHAPAAAGRAMQFECPLVAGSGFGVVADLLVGIPEAVKRAGFSFLAAEVAEQVRETARSS